MIRSAMRWCVGASLLTALLASTPAAVARAQSSATELTSLQWPGVYLRLAEADKRAVIVAAPLFREVGLRLRFEVSAPLDQSSRVAAITDARSRVRGFSWGFYAGYESWLLTYTETATRVLRDVCNPRELPAGADLDTWCVERRRAAAEDHRAAERAASLSMPLSDSETAIGFEHTGSFDRASVRPMAGDAAFVSGRAFDSDDYTLSFGARGALFWSGTHALTARIGLTVARDVETRSVELCTPVDVDPMSTATARACETVQQLESTPEVQLTGYGSLAYTVLFRDVAGDDFVPGLEIGVAMADVGSVRGTVAPRASVFVSPRVADSMLRFGVGFELPIRLEGSQDMMSRAGDVRFVPFLLIGASLGLGGPPLL